MLVQGDMIKESMALRLWGKNVGAMSGFAINNATVCSVSV